MLQFVIELIAMAPACDGTSYNRVSLSEILMVVSVCELTSCNRVSLRMYFLLLCQFMTEFLVTV